jgi:hypothetical protein
MLKGMVKVFDTIVSGNTEVFTPDDFARTLGLGDKLAVHAVVTGVVGTSPTVTIKIYDSADGQNYSLKATPVSVASVSAGAKNDLRGYDTDARPLFPYVRIGVTIGGTSNPGAHVQLLAVSRDQ